ncbi:hypothetical protein RB614_39435 [Phytohabitans sp. ZYX-F-186]|uniref:DUF1963 domain-containing protein n=1 Tax=Phytohabitans maris TaxID=3071409 RepID=A0ABU0ZU66_9ACTN|nr:hypothetical protein [Phytohabitans sp. ZYX-F-186]MDQ7910586.1 hypothetical protein [Phytohabitans sp. ZYX-F-186]
MVRTTPPRPVDVASLVPALAAHARPTTRLHPRPGAPTAAESSIGGPLRWPAGEPWPHCDDPHDDLGELSPPAAVRRRRAVLGAAWARTPRGERLRITEAERAEVEALEPAAGLDGKPVAMVPVAQLYRRDTPGFIGPDGADLLQALWCPLDHADREYCPRVTARWRRAADVTTTLDTPPEPVAVDGNYLPEPCVVHPERVVEYRYGDLLPEALADEVEERFSGAYQYDLSIAPGWKLGGFASWHLTDPYPVDCEECGAPMELLLTAASGEWDGGTGSWRPVEDAEEPEFMALHGPRDPTAVEIGRGYSLWIFYCPRSFGHPVQTAMQ